MEKLKPLVNPPIEQFPEKIDSALYTFAEDQIPNVNNLLEELQKNGVHDVRATQFFYDDGEKNSVTMRITNPPLFEYTVNALLSVQEAMPTLSYESVIDYVMPYLAEQSQQPATSPETGYSV